MPGYSATGRPTGGTPEAAQQALDAAVTAFLDLDNRQSYAADAVAALAESAGPGGPGGDDSTPLRREWAGVAERCLTASAAYLQVSERYAPTDSLGRSTRVDPGAALAAYDGVLRDLAAAAAAVDAFYRRHTDRLEQARAARAAAPAVAAEAHRTAEAAEAALTRADQGGYAYASVLDAAGTLVAAVAALNAAGTPAAQRKAAGAVTAAATGVQERIATARDLRSGTERSLRSVATRLDAVGGRIDGLAVTRSALLREFSAASTADLVGVDERARAALATARREHSDAEATLAAGDVEAAAAHVTSARAKLAAAEADHAAMTDRLRRLRETRADPMKAAESARFRIRDAQRLVVGRGLVREWGSVLDAQVARLDRATTALVGSHPDYWSYLNELAEVEAFVHGVVDKVRAAAAR